MHKTCVVITLASSIASAAATLPLWMLSQRANLPVAESAEPGPDRFLSTDGMNTLDHVVFQHRLQPVAQHIRQANVVFLGNSRSLFALREETLTPFFEERSMSWYHLGFPADGWMFAEHMLSEFDARPGLAIVNADEFFLTRISPMAAKAVKATELEATKLHWESSLATTTRAHLHRVLPRPQTMFFARETALIHRSISNGTWHVIAARGIPEPVKPDTETNTGPTPEELGNARQFQAKLRERDIRLILTCVPRPNGTRSVAETIARELGVPFVAPQIAGLRTIDGSHLDSESADSWAKALLAELENELAAFVGGRNSYTTGATSEAAAARL